MNKKLHPYPVTLFGSVIVLIISIYAYRFLGVTGLILGSLLYVPVGIISGYFWTMYPWRLALIACIPAGLFIIWQSLSSSDPTDMTVNLPFYAFLPLMTLATTYLGAYIGRWNAIRRRITATTGE